MTDIAAIRQRTEELDRLLMRLDHMDRAIDALCSGVEYQDDMRFGRRQVMLAADYGGSSRDRISSIYSGKHMPAIRDFALNLIREERDELIAEIEAPWWG